MAELRNYPVVGSEMETRRQNRLVWLIVIGVAVAVTILAFNRNHADDELIGVWRLESTQTNGQPPRRERELWVFRHGKLTIVRDSRVHRAKIWLDPSASPRHLDTDILFRPIGIYEIAGDTLRVSQVVPNMPRPNAFTTTWGDLRTVSVLRRLDADPLLSEDQLHALLLSEFGRAPEYPERIELDKEADEFIAGLMREIYDKAGEMTAKELVVYHVSWLITEINNGGFHQFFYNSTGEHAVETARYLRTIGAPETATLVEIGCQLFPDESPPKDRHERRAQLERFTLDQLETLRDLEQRFYSRREDLNVLLKSYWEQEP